MSEEERDAAEGYRRDRQRADARRHGFEPITPQEFFRWIEDNDDLLLKIARDNGANETDAPHLVEQYKGFLKEVPSGSEFDERNAQLILGDVIKKIEHICVARKVPIRGGVVFGVAPELGLIASQRPVMTTDVSMINVTLPFIAFGNLISKVMALTLIHDQDSIHVSIDPAEVLNKLRSTPDLLIEWAVILANYAAYGWPPPEMPPSLDEDARFTRALLLDALEWFSIAHEYGHHVMRHGQTQSSDDGGNPFSDEHEADIFARAVSIALAFNEEVPNLYAAFGVGAVVMLGMIDLVRRAKAMLATGSDHCLPRKKHPPYGDRIFVLSVLDQHLPQEHRESAAHMRICFLGIVEVIWTMVRPVMRRLHESGLRPQAGSPDVGGWLPT